MAITDAAQRALDSKIGKIGAAILNATEDLPNMRVGVGITNRDKQIMAWKLPNGSIVQMYINPENFVVAESKQISQVRTKGGFVIQYWGDNLTRLTLSGTTGSAGVRGINVLRDVYHAENRAFEIVAGSQTNELLTTLGNNSLSDESLGSQLLPSVAQTLRERNFILRPSLGSLAVGITLMYQGIQYRGFFTDCTVTESIQKLGMFDYNLSFMATEIRGRRENFMPWHREPLADDSAGQLMNALFSKAGNALRGLAGLSPQQTVPPAFHPETAPLTYGGISIASQLGLESTGLTGLSEPRNK